MYVLVVFEDAGGQLCYKHFLDKQVESRSGILTKNATAATDNKEQTSRQMDKVEESNSKSSSSGSNKWSRSAELVKH